MSRIEDIRGCKFLLLVSVNIKLKRPEKRKNALTIFSSIGLLFLIMSSAIPSLFISSPSNLDCCLPLETSQPIQYHCNPPRTKKEKARTLFRHITYKTLLFKGTGLNFWRKPAKGNAKYVTGKSTTNIGTSANPPQFV